jgi:uncharacterized protein (TIGR02001 family)
MGVALLAGPALADGMPSSGKIASPSSRACSTSGNVAYTTDYVFRGISQSGEHGTMQGGVELSCGKFYLGAWGSGIEFAGGSEVDIYGGYKTSIGKLNIDVGFIYYGYPGAGNTDIPYWEIKAAVNADVWKGGNIGAAVFYSPAYTDLFGFGDTGPVTTVEGTITQTLPKVGMFSPTFSATVGHSHFSDELFGVFDLSYTYWNAGVTLGFLDKWSLDLRYHDTSNDGFASGNPLAGDRFVATLKYSF